MKKKLLNTAFLTSPIIAMILVTPTFVVSGIESFFYPIAVGMATLLIFICWMLNIVILLKVKKNWAGRWQRMVLSSAIMLLVGYIISRFVTPPIPISPLIFELLRTINILAVNSIIFILVDLIMIRESKKTVDLENEKLKLANLENQYRLLMEKLNPHFLFNALGTAKSLIKTNPETAEAYLIQLSGFLRSTIDKEKDVVQISDELDLAFQYIKLQQLRFGSSLVVENKVDKTYYTHKVPYFSILSLVENAVKHNAMTADSPLKISIYNDGSELIVSNILQEKFVVQNAHKSGLNNLSERYRLLFNEKIVIEKTENLFVVRIKMIVS